MNDLSGLCLSLFSWLEVAPAESADAVLSFFNGITIRIRHSGRFTLRVFKRLREPAKNWTAAQTLVSGVITRSFVQLFPSGPVISSDITCCNGRINGLASLVAPGTGGSAARSIKGTNGRTKLSGVARAVTAGNYYAPSGIVRDRDGHSRKIAFPFWVMCAGEQKKNEKP